MIRNFLFIVSVCGLLSCSSLSKKSAEVGMSTDTSISRDEAISRAQQVSNVKYDLNLNFVGGSATTYTGQMAIDFEVVQLRSADLRLDFFGGSVSKLDINGLPAVINYNQRFLLLPAAQLKKGANHVVVQFTGSYSKIDQGLRRFEDPQDHRVYLSTNFEPFGANRMFPCFDQPDLKATFKVTVTTATSDLVVSNVRETKVSAASKTEKVWEFAEGPKISTYIFALMVGPFHVFEDKTADKLVLRVLVRQSLAKYVDAKEWFSTTKSGLQYFANFFKTPYPFSKFDQIITPEQNGAMENVAAITYDERLVSRGTRSRDEKRALAEIILHEMAHQWFGDLVTMKWWDDLWLNESFAEFMEAKALAEATPYTESWQDFIGRKNWGYLEDEKSTTHPIVTDVASTAVAQANFDGITYAKGAAVLKQFLATLGEEHFREGVMSYFRKYAWSNADLNDFLSVMSVASNRDLQPWKKQWLTTSGFNLVQSEVKCDGGHIAQLRISQKEGGGSRILRSHTFKIGLLEQVGSKLVVSHTLPVTLEKSEVVVDGAKGLRCPMAVVNNFGDDGYFRSQMDRETMDQLLPHMSEIQDPFVRQMMWTDLFNQVRFANLNVFAYRYWLVREGLEKEQDPLVLRFMFGSLASTRVGTNVLEMIPRSTAQEKVEYQDQLASLEDAAWKRLKNAAAGSELQRIFFDSFSTLAETKLALDNVRLLLDGRAQLQSFKIDQDQRWRLIYRLARMGQKDSDELITRELQHDNSNRGQESAAAARAAIPEWENKNKLLSLVKAQDPSLTKGQTKRVLSSLFPSNQEELRTRYQTQFFQDFKDVHARDPYLALNYLSLAPNSCQPQATPAIESFLRSAALTPLVQRRFQMYLEDGLNCQKALALARAGGFRAPELPQVPDTHRHHRRHRHKRRATA